MDDEIRRVSFPGNLVEVVVKRFLSHGKIIHGVSFIGKYCLGNYIMQFTLFCTQIGFHYRGRLFPQAKLACK